MHKININYWKNIRISNKEGKKKETQPSWKRGKNHKTLSRRNH